MTPGYYVSQFKIYSRSVEHGNPAQRGTNQMLKIAGGDQSAVNPSSCTYPLDAVVAVGKTPEVAVEE
jgi:hypothetical protein